MALDCSMSAGLLAVDPLDALIQQEALEVRADLGPGPGRSKERRHELLELPELLEGEVDDSAKTARATDQNQRLWF